MASRFANPASLLALAFVMTACGAAPSPSTTNGRATLALLVRGDGFEGALFPTMPRPAGEEPDHKQVYWAPSVTDVAAFEGGLHAYLERELARAERKGDAYLTEGLRGIRDHLVEFRRQYFGIVKDGRRQLFVSAFPKEDSEDEEDRDSWLQEPMIIFDGGFWIWRIWFDPERKAYLALEWNGEA